MFIAFLFCPWGRNYLMAEVVGTRGEWSRAMRYAAVYKPDSEPLDQFIRRKGGINACAARFCRCLGRGRAAW